MFPRRTGAPAALPLTLPECLAHLRADADGGPNDQYVSSLIPVAVAACEERINRTLISTPWRLQLDTFPAGGEIALRMGSVISVQSVTYKDAAGVVQTLSLSAFVLDGDSLPARLVPAVGGAWPATQDGAINAVTVTYTAGFGATAEAVPAPIRHWLLLAVAEMYETRSASAERPVVRNEFVDHLLAPYRVWEL